MDEILELESDIISRKLNNLKDTLIYVEFTADLFANMAEIPFPYNLRRNKDYFISQKQSGRIPRIEARIEELKSGLIKALETEKNRMLEAWRDSYFSILKEVGGNVNLAEEIHRSIGLKLGISITESDQILEAETVIEK